MPRPKPRDHDNDLPCFQMIHDWTVVPPAMRWYGRMAILERHQDPYGLQPGRAGGRSRTFSDERCSQAVLDFLNATDVGRVLAEESEGSKASEWELRERRERGGRRRRWAPRTRWAPGRNRRCSSPHPRSWHRQARIR